MSPPRLGLFLPVRPEDHLRLDPAANAIGCLRSAIHTPLLERLRSADVTLVEDLDFRHAFVHDGRVWCGDTCLNDLDRFFWYGEVDRRPGSFDLQVLEILARDVEVVRDPVAFQVGLDKLRAHEALRRAGVRVAEHVLLDLHGLDRMAALLETWGAALLKPRRGGWGRGVTLIDSPARLRDVLGYVRSTVGSAPDHGFFLERYYDNDPGRWASITVLEGRIVYGYRKTAERFHPLGGGRQKVQDLDERGGGVVLADLTPEHESQALRAAEALGLGLVGLDMIWTDDGPVVVDENTSPGNYAELYAEVGLDPAALFAGWVLRGLCGPSGT